MNELKVTSSEEQPLGSASPGRRRYGALEEERIVEHLGSQRDEEASFTLVRVGNGSDIRMRDPRGRGCRLSIPSRNFSPETPNPLAKSPVCLTLPMIF